MMGCDWLLEQINLVRAHVSISLKHLNKKAFIDKF